MLGVWGDRRVRSAAVVAMAVALTVGLLVVPRPAKAAFTGTNGKIAFLHDVTCPNDPQASCGHIWVMNPDGSGQGDIEASYGGTDTDPAWNPDSTQLAVASSNGLDVINADGSGRRNVTDVASPFQISWSPASIGKIAFSDNCCGTGGDIHTINVDGTGLTTFGGTGINTDPAWQPTGSLIAFASDGSVVPSGPGLYEMDPSNPNSASQIVPESQNWDVWDAAPDWSPDGSKLVFVGQDASSNSHIYVVNNDGTNLHEVATPSLDPAYFHPHWSPDGTKITFDADGPHAVDIWVMDADGSNATDITNYPDTVTAQYPAWGSSSTGGTPPPSTSTTAAPTTTTTTVAAGSSSTTSTTTTLASSGATTTTTTRPTTQSSGTSSPGTALPGQPVTVTGGGFAPNQPVGATADNPPTSLGTGSSDPSGNVTMRVTIPANAAPGPETITLVGPDPSGGSHKVTATLTVVAAGTANAGAASVLASTVARPVTAVPSFTG